MSVSGKPRNGNMVILISVTPPTGITTLPKPSCQTAWEQSENHSVGDKGSQVCFGFGLRGIYYSDFSEPSKLKIMGILTSVIQARVFTCPYTMQVGKYIPAPHAEVLCGEPPYRQQEF
jgi:hypothetical protein